MSAYASSFESLLPSLTSSLDGTNINAATDMIQTVCETAHEGKKEQSDPKNESKIHVKVQSASVDFGVVAAGGVADFNSIDDAVQFKLLINFIGRKYTITRTFAEFVQLRKSLVKEWITEHRQIIEGIKNSFSSKATAEMTIPSLPNGESCHSSNDSDEDLTAKYAGLSGFAKVQSLLLYHYCPLMESWLKRVMDTIDVENSVCLNNFFWEPLREDENVVSFIVCTSMPHENSHCGRRRSSAISAISLSSIPEYDFNDLED